MTDVRRERLAAIAVILMIGLHAIVVLHLVSRTLDHDEAEHLRAAEWLASGKTLYGDFVENHTPFLYAILETFAPTRLDIDELQRYVTTSRLLAALAGTLAALCVAAVAKKATADAVAIVVALCALLARGWTFDRSILDIRSEPFTLLLFWAGVLLVIRARPIVSGVGVGLIAVAALWNPKWPLETAAVAVLYFVQLWRGPRKGGVAASLIAAAVPPLIAIVVALRMASFGALVFFGYRYPAAYYAWFRSSRLVETTFRLPAPFEYCSMWFRPLVAIPAIALFAVLVASAWQSLDRMRRRLVLLLAAFVIGGALEIRFLYSYPRLWPQYFAMWGCSLAALYAVTLSEAARRFKYVGAAALFIFALFVVGEVLEVGRAVDQTHWDFKNAVLATLRPDEGVWMQPEDCPFPAPAGSYYWYAYKDQVPFSLAYAGTPEARRWLPAIGEGDLPPCRMLAAHMRGALAPGAVYVRYVDERNLRNLPQSQRCLAALVQAKLAERMGGSSVYEIRPPTGRAGTQPD